MATPQPEDLVLLIEDHELFAEVLALALRNEGYQVRRLSLAGEADPVTAALREHPAIALLDLDLGPYGDGTRLIEPLSGAGVKVVVVTASQDRAEWGGCLRRGARAVLGKTGPLEEVVDTVGRLRAGLPAMPQQTRDELLALWQRDRRDADELRDRFARLTARERVILGALAEGHGVHDIAASDVVSEATVRTQIKSILAKLEVSSQLAAVALAHRNGWPPEHGTVSADGDAT